MTATLTAAELYARSAEMRAFVASWVEHRRCPLPFVDYLLEHELPVAAEAARWAATEEDRSGWTDAKGGHELIGPYPGQQIQNHWWYATIDTVHARDVPLYHIHKHLRKGDAKNTEEAILWLLDNWIP